MTCTTDPAAVEQSKSKQHRQPLWVRQSGSRGNNRQCCISATWQRNPRGSPGLVPHLTEECPLDLSDIFLDLLLPQCLSLQQVHITPPQQQPA